MKVDIVNGKGESVSKLPGDRRRLLVELKVIWHGRTLQLLDNFSYLIKNCGSFCYSSKFIYCKLVTMFKSHNFLIRVETSSQCGEVLVSLRIQQICFNKYGNSEIKVVYTE